MKDPSLVVQAVLVYTVLAAGVLATVLTGFAQLRLFTRAWKLGPNAALVRRGFLAASVGMGSVGGSIIALELGGPGAIGWMWVASLLGMALIYADVLLAVRFRRGPQAGSNGSGMGRRAATVFAFADGIPKLGKPLAYVYSLVFSMFALAAGAMLQTQQSSALLTPFGGDHWLVAGFLVFAAALGMIVPKLRTFVAALGPVAVMLYVVALLWVLARAPGSAGEALGMIVSGMSTGEGSTLAGGATGLLVALQVGFLRATLATEAGLGSAGFTPEADRSKDPQEAASAAMLAPLISGIVVPTLTALVVLCATPWTEQRIDEPAERVSAADERVASEADRAELAAALDLDDPARLSDADAQRLVPLWAPLERPMSRGTAASLQAGQTVVLPLDALAPEGSTTDDEGLLEDHVYPMVMRASPRGVKVRIEENKNEIVLGRSEETEVIREVVFRDRDPERAKYPAYDIRVPVENEVFGPEHRKLVRLKPVDPEVDLYRLSRRRDGPYAVFGDFHFQGRIVQMHHTRWGVHHAVIQADSDPPGPLTLRSTVESQSFRGPYLDSGELRPPLAMVAREDFDAPIGARLPMVMPPPERGVEIGQLLASGELQTPPWRFLAETKVAVLRHKTDPSRDMRIPVTSKLVDGHLRFLSGRRDIADFAKADRWAAYTGPYLLPPPYEFEVEVHSGLRFPASSAYLGRLGQNRKAFEGPFSERKTLVAVHPHGEPQGSPREVYDPHPAEVAPFMEGPRVSGSGIERLAWASRLSIKRGADLLLALSILILALTTMIAWSSYGARAADFMLGRGAGIGFRVMFLGVGLFGAGLAIGPILAAVDSAMLGLVALNGVGMVVLLLRSRKTQE
ncbi:MAG: alanine:cation symporter family protein [Enhygromyxa sp.]